MGNGDVNMVKQISAMDNYIKHNQIIKDICNNKYDNIINQASKLSSIRIKTIEKLQPISQSIERLSLSSQYLTNLTNGLDLNLNSVIQSKVINMIENNSNFIELKKLRDINLNYFHDIHDIIDNFKIKGNFLEKSMSSVSRISNISEIATSKCKMLGNLTPKVESIVSSIPNETIDRWNSLSRNKQYINTLLKEINDTISGLTQEQLMKDNEIRNNKTLGYSIEINYGLIFIITAIIASIFFIFPKELENKQTSIIEEKKIINSEEAIPKVFQSWNELEDIFSRYQLLWGIIKNVFPLMFYIKPNCNRKKAVEFMEDELKIMGIINYNNKFGLIKKYTELRCKPNNNGGVVEYLQKDRSVIIHSKYKKWLKVTYYKNKEDNLTGWVSSKHITYKKEKNKYL